MTSPIDSAIAALLADPRSAMRPPREGTMMAEYRQRLDAPMTAARGPDVHAIDTLAGEATGIGVPIRVYTPCENPVGTILFIHGGGFVIGSLETHDAMCRSLALASDARIVAVEYRLAPENPFPAARNDCLAALRWAAHGQGAGAPMAICGDSAGGHLAVGVALEAVAAGIRVDALGLFYPVADPAMATGSWARFGTGHILTRAWMEWAWAAYLAGADPTAAAFTLRHADLSCLPPTHVITAEYDPLRDEGETLVAAILAAGGSASVTRAPGMIHGFASLAMLTPAADAAIESLADRISQHMC